MPGFSRRPLAVFVCCLFAGTQAGYAAVDLERTIAPAADSSVPEDGQPLLLAANDLPLNLRQERKFDVLKKKKEPVDKTQAAKAPIEEKPVELKPDDSYPLFIIADQIEGQADEVTEAEGNVELRKVGNLLYADRLTYRPLDDEVDATGSVRLLQDGSEISGPHLRMKMDAQIGSAEQVTYHIVRDVPSRFYAQQQTVVTVASSNANTSGAPMMLNVANSYGLPTQLPPPRPSEANGYAERIDFEGENQMSLFGNTYSTCKPGSADWYLKTAETHLDYDEGKGTARDATLWFQGAPIFYTPLASFPLNNQRRSGILHPHFSTSTRSGLDLTVPYYFNLAPNYDLTLTPRYLSKRGTQLGADARYIDYNYEGQARVEYMANDEVLGRSRYAYRFDHRQNLGRGFSTTINWNGVSDDYYWQDLTSRLLQTSQTQLPRQVSLGYSPSPWLQTNMQVLRYQTLQIDPANPIARPYFLEPQLNLIAYKPNLLKTDFAAIGQYSRFTHVDPTKVQGDRVVLYPQISLPIVHPAFQITPKVGLHLTKYSLDEQASGLPNTYSRALPTFSLDSTVVFEREGDWFGKGYIQTLEPRLYYVNIPYKDQSQIPLFDTALSDFNFAQIFSENRYSGYDRINDANQLTAGLTTRLLDGETGVERFKAMIGQRYYFQPQRVSIPGETTRQQDFSNIVAAFNGLVAPKTYMDLATEYNYRENVIERFSAGARFQPEFGKVLSASYRYTRDALTGASTVDQMDFAGQWPLSANWYAVGRYNYSLRDSKALEVIAGVEYNASCWSLRLVGQRLAAISGTPNETLFLQLELNDFGSIGANPIGMLRRSIPGYGKINELPTDSHLLTP
ncbi:MAG TPA: LPS-assembly protein LptD [Azonexus sp.]|nr:LPS-assembly protein LptD [Azonexus sp.]